MIAVIISFYLGVVVGVVTMAFFSAKRIREAEAEVECERKKALERQAAEIERRKYSAISNLLGGKI